MSNKKILAIDPGTKHMGYAFFDKGKLIYHGVVVIKAKTPDGKLKEGKRKILRLIKDFRPNVLVVERAFFGNNKTAAIMNVLVSEIMSIGKRKGLKVISYAPTTVRKSICGNGRADKKALSEIIVSKMPELKVYLTQDRAWKERYHQNMFDAVALGLMACIQ
jgi:crossover junction endodeoxyribonuclease RuvC